MAEENFEVEVDEDLKEIIPGYLENLKKDLQELQSLCSGRDVDSLAKLTHKIKGSAGGYGFTIIGNKAATLEKMALDNQINDEQWSQVQADIDFMSNFLAQAKINYIVVE